MKSKHFFVITVLVFLFFSFFSPSIIAQTTPTPSMAAQNRQRTNPILDFLTIFLNFYSTISNGPSSTTYPSGGYGSSGKTGAGGLVYYPQCNGSYDTYPLPSGCNVCRAGCGPTSVAMIVASYVDKTVNPTTIVDLYKKNNFFLGCDGSRYSDAKSALSQYGLKTTDYLIYSGKNIQEIAGDFRSYIKSGWGLFALASYCEGGCGHFFWITDIDNNNNVWAYDPYYGRKQAPPLNESIYDPFPQYRVVFGVKK